MVKVRIAAVFATVVAAVLAVGPVAAGPVESNGYKVLKPIESGDLTLFPVVRAGGKMPPADQFLTLDEGLKNGEVEVTEAGRVWGLVRSRGGATLPNREDQVNTLVLVNNSKRPLLLLAGEIVTGGKQDRVIAKDRIVPPGGDPIDLGVFCVEPGRWVGSSEQFGTARGYTFMAAPNVRAKAMADKDQAKGWWEGGKSRQSNALGVPAAAP